MRAMRCGGVLATVLVMLGGPAAAADAATVTGRSEIVFELDFGRGMDIVDYEAAPGETNQATVTLSADATTVTVIDPSATLTAAGRCTQVDDHTVSCPTDSKLVIPQVDLGDGDDRLTVVAPGTAPYRTKADGGPGNDTLATGPADDEVVGGDGDDVLDTGAGDDVIDEGATAGRDAIEGGAGRDRVSYTGRTEPLQLTLSAPTATDTDALTGVEDVTGGDGADLLTGDGAANELRGGAGDDVLAGGGGGDVLAGEAGRDEAACGSALDVLEGPDLHAPVHRSCESVRLIIDADRNGVPEYIYEEPARPFAVTQKRVTLTFRCPQRFGYDFVHRQPIPAPADCDGRLRILSADGRRRLGPPVSFRGTSYEAREVVVSLTRHGGKLLTRKGGADFLIATSGEKLPPVRWRTRTPR